MQQTCVNWNSEIKDGFSYQRPSGTQVVAPLYECILPWSIVINDAGAVATGYELTLNSPIDFVQKIVLVSASGSALDTRRISIVADTGSPVLDTVRVSSTNEIVGDLVLTPGASYGPGWVIKTFRDSGGSIPRRIRVVQKTIAGAAFAGDHRINLSFNVHTTKFQ